MALKTGAAGTGPSEAQVLDMGGGCYALTASGLTNWLHWNAHAQATVNLAGRRLTALGFERRKLSAVHDPQDTSGKAPPELYERPRVDSMTGLPFHGMKKLKKWRT